MNRHFLLLLLIAFAGCTYPTFTNPIVEPDEAQRFDDLFGVYQAKHPDTGEISWLHIGRCDDNLPRGFHKFVAISPPAAEKNDQGLTVGEYIGLVFKKENSYIVQLPCTKDGLNNQAATISKEWGKSKIDDYLLVRLKQLGNRLQVDLLAEESIEKIVDDKILAGRFEQKIDKTTDPPTIGPKSVFVTAGTVDLGKFFATNDHDSLFKDSGFVFTKYSVK